MATGIIPVFFWGSPSKVLKHAAASIAVFVTSLMRSSRPRPNKVIKNHYVNGDSFAFSVTVKRHDRISTFGDCPAKNLPFQAMYPYAASNFSINRSNAAKIRYFVKAFIGYDWAPFFDHSSPPLVNDPYEGRGSRYGNRRSAAKPSRAQQFYVIGRKCA